MTMLLSMGKAFCEATAVQVGYTLVQSTVAVVKISESITGSIEPSYGVAEELSATLELDSNDGETFFVVYSTLVAENGQVLSAFDSNGNLLFANTAFPPTEDAVTNAKNGSGSNANVIAYKMTLEGNNLVITNEVSKDYNECFKVVLADSITSAELSQRVGGSPVNNTYSRGEDVASSYKATVYITAVKEI